MGGPKANPKRPASVAPYVADVPSYVQASTGVTTPSQPSSGSRPKVRPKKSSAARQRSSRKRQASAYVKRSRARRDESLVSAISSGMEGLGDVLADIADKAGDLPGEAVRAAQKGAVAAAKLPDKKVTEAFGKPTLGTPTVGELLELQPNGRLAKATGVKVKGPVVSTPKARKAAKDLKRAEKVYRKRAMPNIEGLPSEDQERFAEAFAKASGLPPKLAGDWALREGGGWGSDGVSGGEAGEQNWLGIGYPGEQTAMSRSGYFNNVTPEQAGKNAARWIRGEIGSEYSYRAADSIQAIDDLVKSGASDAEIRAYIAGPSAWGTGEIPNSPQVTASPGKAGPKVTNQLKAARTKAGKLGIVRPRGSKPAKPKLPSWALSGPNAKGVKSAIEVLGKKPLEKWLAPTNSGTAGYFRNIANLNPVLARQLVKVAKESGEPITVTSGYRSMVDQSNIDSGTNPKAAVGYSEHQFGMAADTEMSANQEALLPKYGLQKGSGGPGSPGNDPPHTSLIDQNLIREAMKYGPIRAAWGPEEWNSVGDLGDFSLPANFGTGGSSVAGAVYAPAGGTSSAGTGGVSAPAGGTKGKPRGKRRKKQLSTLQEFNRNKRKLRQLGVPLESAQPSAISEESTPVLSELERHYGKAAV